MDRSKTNVLIAGGGVAALEAALALRTLAADLVRVTFLSPNERFIYRPLAVPLPFDGGGEVRFELSALAEEIGASFVHGALTGVDTWRRVVHASIDRSLEYDVLLIACGALPMASVRGAVTFRGAAD